MSERLGGLDKFAIVANPAPGRTLFRSSQPRGDAWETVKNLGVTMIYKLDREDEEPLADEVAQGFEVHADPPSHREVAPDGRQIGSVISRSADQVKGEEQSKPFQASHLNVEGTSPPAPKPRTLLGLDAGIVADAGSVGWELAGRWYPRKLAFTGSWEREGSAPTGDTSQRGELRAV